MPVVVETPPGAGVHTPATKGAVRPCSDRVSGHGEGALPAFSGEKRSVAGGVAGTSS